MTGKGRDFIIIIGGGPAGCVLAARLSENPRHSVLLIEAGPDYGPDVANWPPAMLDPVGLHAVDIDSWDYFHTPDASDRRLQLPRARVIGGSTAINGAMWIRGSQSDYDAWAAAGNPGWDWRSLLPYLQRAENDPAGAAGLHGDAGPVTIERIPDAELSALDRAFLETAQELNFPYVDDINGEPSQFPSVGKTPKNLSDGHRFNAALSYLALARDRPNLEILPDTLIDRLLIEDGVVTGVRKAAGQDISGAEVILCCGAYGSPAILLRSGIGPADELRDLDITPISDLPGVGRNLMDHPQVGRQTGLTTFRIQPDTMPDRPSFINTMLKARSSQSSSEIDIHFYPGEAYDEELGEWTIAYGVSLQFARSTGTVRLTSSDPADELLIDHNYFSDPRDLEAICDGFELLQRFTSTPPLSNMLIGPVRQGPHLHDRDALKETIKAEVCTTYHPSSTCKMGPAEDAAAVVDHHCRIHGLDGVRVVDASIFPFGPHANLHYTVCAAAERAAGLESV